MKIYLVAELDGLVLGYSRLYTDEQAAEADLDRMARELGYKGDLADTKALWDYIGALEDYNLIFEEYDIELPDAVQKGIREVAERLIGSYVQAVEQGDIFEPDCWIHEEDHWRFDFSDGMELLKIVGLSAEEAEVVAQDVREHLGEMSEEDEEDDQAFDEGEEDNRPLCGCPFCDCANRTIAGEVCNDCLEGAHQG